MTTQAQFTIVRSSSRQEMGTQSERDVAACIQALLKEQDHVNIIFAAAPSQNDFLEKFVSDTSVDFSRIHAFHMDEYIGLSADAPQGFANFLKRYLFDKAPFGEVNLINGSNDPKDECRRYGELLRKNPPDIVVMGIGENGHIAFNDPAEADFEDPKIIKSVTLDAVCRQQQVNDKCFDTLSQVPTHALTLTVPTLANAKYHFCIVPTALKAQAVKNTVTGIVGAQCPASVLRLCAHAKLYIDDGAASLLPAFFQ